MAFFEASEESIAQVMEVLSLDQTNDREMVIQALKTNHGNTESVILQYFEGEDSFRTKYQKVWDDSMFHADRDGSSNNAGISFHVESSDHDVIQGVTPPPDSRSFGAPSRPPSRSNNRSPLGMMVDWTAAQMPGIARTHSAEHALTIPYAGVPNSQAQEDDDMKRAIRESAQEAGITMPQHESGITGPSEPAAAVFGPANRETYDEGNWAMVPSKPSKETTPNEVLPSKRKRTPGAPVMLINNGGQGGDHHLGGLLTIMHEIPIARNILLQIGTPAATYGHNNDWWRGQEILSPEVLAKMAHTTTWDHREHKSDSAFDEEIHRLMAFLDSTERGYGSISVLSDLLSLPHNTGMEKQFYEMLGQRHPDSIQPITQVAALAMFHGDDLEEDARFGLLEIEHLRNEYRCIKTLYEALDHVMWSDTLGWDRIHEGSKMAFFKEMGEVLVLNTAGDGPEDSIEIPQELYPEKYLRSRKDEARRIQRGWCQTKEEMARLLGEKELLYRMKESWDNGNIDDKRALLRKAADQWGEYKNYLEGFARFQTLENSGFDTNKYPDYHAAPPHVDNITNEQHGTVTDVIDYSEKLLAGLETRTQGLDAELEQIMAKQRFLGRLLTVPDKPGRPTPMTCNKYLLRGVVTTPGIVYVCQREEADLIDFNGEGNKPSDQWWRLAFTPYEDKAVHAEKIEIEEVFKNMWKETKKPLLVYATEEALEKPRVPLPSQLERFVKAENKAFRQELSREDSTPNEVEQTTTFDYISPSKRKHRADSTGSMDSNRASIGSDDRNGFDNPFSDQDESIGMETTDYEGSSHFVRSFTAAGDDIPPSLPDRPQASKETMTESPSATMTPSTVGADHIENVIPTEEESRNPEMQEKARPPPFMSLSRNPSEQKEPVSLMDMDIPDDKQ